MPDALICKLGGVIYKILKFTLKNVNKDSFLPYLCSITYLNTFSHKNILYKSLPLNFTKHSENNVYPLRRSYSALKMFSIIHAKNLVKYEPIVQTFHQTENGPKKLRKDSH